MGEGLGVRVFPRGHPPNFRPYRTVQRFVQFLRQFQQAAVARIGIVAFLVDVQKGNAGFEGGVLVATPGNQHIGVSFFNNFQQFSRTTFLQHDSLLT